MSNSNSNSTKSNITTGNANSAEWQNASPSNPCPICGKTDWCNIKPEGVVLCRRADYHPTFGRGDLKNDGDGGVYYYYSLSRNTQSNPVTLPPHFAANSDSKPAKQKTSTLQPERLDEVYRFLLSQLELSTDHASHLRERGFTDEQITRNGYRTLPPRGRAALARAIINRFGETVATETPGVYLKVPSEENGNSQNQSSNQNQSPSKKTEGYYSLGGIAGLIIPIRNVEQQIAALKIRSFDPESIAKYGKYLTLASTNKPSGTAAGDHCHIVYDSTFVDKTLFITEGELKAELASHLLRRNFISLPGAGKWRAAIPIIERLSAKQVVIALDNDLWTNPYVARYLREFYGALIQNGVDTAIADWRDSEHKGIDDLLAAGGEPRIVNGASADQLIEDAVTAANAENPSPAQTALAKALENLTGFEDKVNADVGHIYKQKVINSLYEVERQDKSEWARVCKILRKNRELKNVEKQFKLIEQRRAAMAADFHGSYGGALQNPQVGGDYFQNKDNISYINQSAAAEHAQSLPILQECIDAPILKNSVQMHVPSGYDIKEDGIWKMPFQNGGYPERILKTPSFIRKLYRDSASGNHLAEIVWRKDNKWITETVKKSQIMDARKIVALSDKGLPVNSNSSGDLSNFYLQFESDNERQLPCETITASMSWQKNSAGDISGFLLGETFLPSPSSKENRDDYVHFFGGDDGETSVAKSVQSKGDLSEWMNAFEKIHNYPRALVMVYASFASVLLPLIKCPSFIIDLSCQNSTGKSTVLKIAASIWGNPVQEQPDSFFNTYNATPVWIERTAGTLRNLPLIIDDSKQMRFKKHMDDLIYNFCASKGRQRGTIAGTAITKSWNSIMLSTGEGMITDYAEGSGGAAARVIPIACPVSPFESMNRAELVYEIDICIKENYGHAGEMWVKWILGNLDKVTFWQSKYRERIRDFVDMVRQISGSQNQTDLSAINRICERIALIDIAGALVHQALDMPFQYGDPFQFLLEDLATEFSNTDKPTLALQDVCLWASQHKELFVHQDSSMGEVYQPKNVIAPVGRWDYKKDWDCISFFPHELRRVIEESNYDFREIKRAWRNRGWLKLEGETKNRDTVKVGIGNKQNPRMISILRKPIDKVDVFEENENYFDSHNDSDDIFT